MLRENVQQNANQQKNRKLQQHNHAASQKRPPAVLLIPRRQQSLHDGLIGPMTRHRKERASNHPGPKRIFCRPMKRKIEHLQLVPRSRGDLRHLTPASRNPVQQNPKRHRAARQIQQELYHVGPDHRLHPAFQRVKHGERNHYEHREPLRGPQYDADHQRNRRHADTLRYGPGDQKRRGCHRTRPLSKSLLDQRIRRKKLPAKIARQQEQHDQYPSHQIPKHELQKCQIPAIRNRRRPDDRKCRSLRSHNRKCQSPPRRRSPTQKIFTRILRSPPEPHPQPSDAQKIDDHDRKIDRMNAHCATRTSVSQAIHSVYRSVCRENEQGRCGTGAPAVAKVSSSRRNYTCPGFFREPIFYRS